MLTNTNLQAIYSFIDSNIEIARKKTVKKNAAADKAKALADAAFKEVQENEPKLNAAKSLYKSVEEEVHKAMANGFNYGNSLENRLCEARRNLFQAEKTHSELTSVANDLKAKADKAESASKLAAKQFIKIKFKAPIHKNSLDMHALSIKAIGELTDQIKILNQQFEKLISKNVQPKGPEK